MGHETNLSAEPPRPQTPSWLPRAHGDRWRPQGSGAAQGAWPQEAVGLTEQHSAPNPISGLSIERIRIRAHFLRAARGIRRTAPGLTLEMTASPPICAKPDSIRVGFTASRKIGGAVERNRAKRRLRAAAAAVLPLYGLGGNDYVLVARRDTLTRPFQGLLGDLTSALHAAHARLGRSESG
jgi:ribonuclease P protein component